MASKRKRVPWRQDHVAGDPVITVPVFLAYCGVAAALRSYNRPDLRFIAALNIESDEATDSYVEAATIFLNRLGDHSEDDEPFVRVLQQRGQQSQYGHEIIRRATRAKRAILIYNGGTGINDEAALFCDVVATMPPPSDRQFLAALKCINVHPSAADLEMLQSESWKRLSFAFKSGTSPMKGLRRLRQLRPVPVKADAPLLAQGPTLADLHGYGAIADWGFELARDLADFKDGRIDWSEVDAGVLISGPPGTGKTLFAEALARTCRVPIVYGTAAQWQAAGYLNDFLKAMNSDFDEAISLSPSILFIDEIDAFGDRARGDGSNADYRRQAISGLLERLDGFNRRTGVVVVGACNHPEHLDAAIRRAGRLDRHFAIEPPDAVARLQILKYHTELELSGEEAARFVRFTNGMTGADIRQLAKDAKRLARRNKEELCSAHILERLPSTRVIPADYLRATAIHEAGHAIVGLELGCGTLKLIQILDEVVSGAVSPVGSALFETPPFGRRTRQSYLDRIAMVLGGIAAETVVLGSFSDGATGGDSSDLVTATRIATLVEACRGMGETLLVEAEDERTLARLREASLELRRSVQTLLAQELERAKAIIERNRSALEELVSKLFEVRYVTGEAAEAILTMHRGYRTHVSLRKVP
jgi:ATP-dependent metalloprotease